MIKYITVTSGKYKGSRGVYEGSSGKLKITVDKKQINVKAILYKDNTPILIRSAKDMPSKEFIVNWKLNPKYN